MRKNYFLLVATSIVILELVFVDHVFSEIVRRDVKTSGDDSEDLEQLPRLDNRSSSPRRSTRLQAARERNGNRNGNNGNANRRQKGNCTKINIENGVTTFKQRGVMVRYMCSHGYELFGSDLAFCFRGQWSEPAPICTRPGCRPLFFPVGGYATSLFSGSVMEFSCNPGYDLKGSSMLFCDGIRWNGTEPACEAVPLPTIMPPPTTTPSSTTNSTPILQSRFPLRPPPTTMPPMPNPNLPSQPNSYLFDTTSHSDSDSDSDVESTTPKIMDENEDDIDVSWKIFTPDINNTTNGESPGNATTALFLPSSSSTSTEAGPKTTEPTTTTITTTRATRESEPTTEQPQFTTAATTTTNLTTIRYKILLATTESPSNSIHVFPTNSQNSHGPEEVASFLNATSLSQRNDTINMNTNSIENESTPSVPNVSFSLPSTTSTSTTSSATTESPTTATTTTKLVVTNAKNQTWPIRILPTNTTPNPNLGLNRSVVVPEIMSMNRSRPSSISVASCTRKNYHPEKCLQFWNSLRNRNKFVSTSNPFSIRNATTTTTATPFIFRPNVLNMTTLNFPFLNATSSRRFPNVRVQQNYSSVVRTGNSGRVNYRNKIRSSTTRSFTRVRPTTTAKTVTTTVTVPTFQIINTSTIDNSLNTADSSINNNNTQSNFDNTLDQYIKASSGKSNEAPTTSGREREEIEKITEEKEKQEFITPFTLNGLTNTNLIEGVKFSQPKKAQKNNNSILITSVSILLGVALMGSVSVLILRMYRKFKGIARPRRGDCDGKNLSVHHDAEEDFVYFGNGQW